MCQLAYQHNTQGHSKKNSCASCWPFPCNMGLGRQQGPQLAAGEGGRFPLGIWRSNSNLLPQLCWTQPRVQCQNWSGKQLWSDLFILELLEENRYHMKKTTDSKLLLAKNLAQGQNSSFLASSWESPPVQKEGSLASRETLSSTTWKQRGTISRTPAVHLKRAPSPAPGSWLGLSRVRGWNFTSFTFDSLIQHRHSNTVLRLLNHASPR